MYEWGVPQKIVSLWFFPFFFSHPGHEMNSLAMSRIACLDVSASPQAQK
jgi:hypothetical protein